MIVQSVSMRTKCIIPEIKVKTKKNENNEIVEFQAVSNNSSDIKCAIYAKLAKHKRCTKVGRNVSE